MKRAWWIVIGALLVALPLQGQRPPPPRPLMVSRVRDLTFGIVLPGVPRVVLRTDPANSGEFVIRGPNRGQVLLAFALPVAICTTAIIPIIERRPEMTKVNFLLPMKSIFVFFMISNIPPPICSAS